MAHPDDSILLAYTRQQPLGEDWQRVHLHIARCEQCQLRCKQLAETSTMLSETLAHFQYSQVYPLLSESVIELAQNPAAARLVRQKRRQARLRQDIALGKALVLRTLAATRTILGNVLVSFGHLLMPGLVKPRQKTMASIPVFGVVILLLLFVVVAAFVVFAFPLIKPVKPGNPLNKTSPVNQLSGATVSSHPLVTATPNMDNKPTVPGGPTVTAVTSQPMLKLCAKSGSMPFSLLHICGYNFTPNAKVELTITTAGGQTRTLHVVSVNGQGTFQVPWMVIACKDYPVAVSAQDLTHPLEVIARLQNHDLGQCIVPTPLPAAGHGKYK